MSDDVQPTPAEPWRERPTKALPLRGGTRLGDDDTETEGRPRIDPLPPPEVVGRYTMLERIGQGGMGVVHRGWDPQLRRAVAIKLLRTDAIIARNPEVARARLVREAQVLARFAHPSVVQVFDVGTEGDTVWLAMELVEGQTLGRWLRSAPRTHAEILRVFAAAGRGLAAAHAQGLVHRDFKPDNVFVGDDGRVRVGDFGLVRAAATTSVRDPSDRRVMIDIGAMDLGATALTGAGLVLGTPGYMAPEQHYGEPTDARTDQYAYCVSLWEALYGTRPFTGGNARELAEAKTARRLPRVTGSPRVPPMLHRAIVRGLAPTPGERWPAMEPLIAVIEHASKPRMQRWIIGGLTVVGLGGALAVGLPDRAGVCEAGADRIATTWNASRRADVESAFLATGVTYASDTWARVDPLLGAWTRAWADTHRQVCRATHIDAAQSQRELDVRMRCLEEQLLGFQGMVEGLAQADAAVVRASSAAARMLPPPRECAERVVDEHARLPDDPTRAKAVLALADRLAQHDGAADAGALDDEVPAALRILAEARELEWDPVIIRAEIVVARALEHSGRYHEAIDHLLVAHERAIAGGLEVEAANAALRMVWLQGRWLSDAEAAALWLRHASAAVERMPFDAQWAAELANMTGIAATTAGRIEEAYSAYARAFELYNSSAGPDHPHTATAMTNLGTAALSRGDSQQARDLHQQVLEQYERTLGPEHPDVAIALTALASARMRMGELTAATAELERAIAIRRRAFGVDHPEVAESLNNLGAALELLGDYAAAERTYREAARIFSITLAPDHASVGVATTNVGFALERQGRYDEAIATIEHARRLFGNALPADHPFAVTAEYGFGAALRGAGRLEESEQALAHADAACPRSGGDAWVCALVRFELARVRMQSTTDADARTEALAIARAAWTELQATPYVMSDAQRSELASWLQKAAP